MERRKSANNLQFLLFEQRQFEKRLSARAGSDQLLQSRQRSTSDASDRRMTFWQNASETKLNESLNNSNLAILLPPKYDQLRFSVCSEGDPLEQYVPSEDDEQNDDLKLVKKKGVQAPAVAVIPPDEDI